MESIGRVFANTSAISTTDTLAKLDQLSLLELQILVEELNQIESMYVRIFCKRPRDVYYLRVAVWSLLQERLQGQMM